MKNPPGRMPEFWLLSFPIPGIAPRLGTLAEEGGLDGIVFADTQNLAGDPYSELCLVARSTTNLKLGTGVTNPVTRHPAVTASAIATVQAESSGRAVLGIGRGDSSLAYLGMNPAPVHALELYVERVQAYLAGEGVDLDGFESQNQWIDRTGLPKVPVDVAATGPRVIGVGARLAERITFAVGADAERISASVETAHFAAREAGRGEELPNLGAFVNVGVNKDAAAARDLIRGGLGSFAHFSGMSGADKSKLDPGDREIFEVLGAKYDMARHGMRSAGHAEFIDDAFVDRFGVAGDSEYCVRRLGELLDAGVERLVIVAGSRDADAGEFFSSNARLMHEVVPALREQFTA